MASLLPYFSSLMSPLFGHATTPAELFRVCPYGILIPLVRDDQRPIEADCILVNRLVHAVPGSIRSVPRVSMPSFTENLEPGFDQCGC